MTRFTRQNQGGSSTAPKTDLASQVHSLEEHVHNSISELKQLITGTAAKNTKNDSYDPKELLAKLNTFRDETQKTLNSLKIELSKLQQQTSTVEKRIQEQKQLSYQNSIMISGLPENTAVGNDIVESVVNIVNSKLKISLSSQDINYCYRLGKHDDQREKPRPVAVFFTNRWKRDKVFGAKKNLKGSGVVFSELLTKEKLNLFKKAVSKYGIKNCWTWRGNVYSIINDNKIHIISENDIH